MANSEDIKLFFQGVDAWNEGVEARSKDNKAWDEKLRLQQNLRVQTDLSDAEIGMLMWRRVGQEQGFFLEQATHYPRADFSFCDLRRTNFQIACGFDFRAATFLVANLQGANLTQADLTQAQFFNCDLENAVLAGTILDDVRFEDCNLIGTDLTATCPWRANLFASHTRIPGPGAPNATSISCVADLIEICLDLRERSDYDRDAFRFYYRGEPKRWKLRPSVMRQRSYRKEEGRMLLEMMTRRPENFAGMTTTLSQWVLAQHHGLKTRLLDVTKNPLVALFYTCVDDDFVQEEGRLHVFAVPNELAKPYDSDAISIITNFAKLSRSEQNLLLGRRRGVEWYKQKYADVMGKLYHFIGQEKPHFQRRIDPKDLFRVFVVEPQQSIERLRVQSGAFLISAFHERFESDQILRWNKYIPTYEHYTLTIPPDCKRRILKELSLLNITHETLFPSLDEAARAVTNEYESSVSNRNTAVNSRANSTWQSLQFYIDLERSDIPPDKRLEDLTKRLESD